MTPQCMSPYPHPNLEKQIDASLVIELDVIMETLVEPQFNSIPVKLSIQTWISGTLIYITWDNAGHTMQAPKETKSDQTRGVFRKCVTLMNRIWVVMTNIGTIAIRPGIDV